MTDIKKYTEHPSRGVKAQLSVEYQNGIAYDTAVKLEGEFCISGQDRQEFLRKLGELINQYRI